MKLSLFHTVSLPIFRLALSHIVFTALVIAMIYTTCPLTPGCMVCCHMSESWLCSCQKHIPWPIYIVNRQLIWHMSICLVRADQPYCSLWTLFALYICLVPFQGQGLSSAQKPDTGIVFQISFHCTKAQGWLMTDWGFGSRSRCEVRCRVGQA